MKTNNSEIRWFNEATHYLSIPIEIRKNYILKEYIGTTKNQGKLNEPDFILENVNNKETIGLEIVELNPLVFHFSKEIRNFQKLVSNYISKLMSKKVEIFIEIELI